MMRRASPWGLEVLLPCVLAAWTVPGLSAQTVEGRVLEAASERGIPAALVELLPGEEESDARAGVSADVEGAFQIQAPSTGTYRLRVSRIGYATVTTPPFDLLSGEAPLDVAVLMAAEAVPIAPLVIRSQRLPPA